MTTKDDFWWQSLTEECPITLESLSSLPYPPFALTSGSVTSYFDGLALASYIVSRGIFQNPLTREELSLADCRRLDEYLETHCRQRRLLSIARKISVAEAFGLRTNVRVDPGRHHMSESRARALQNTATAALAGLFLYGNDRGHQEDSASPITHAARQHQDQLVLEWGFDLTRTVDDPNGDYVQDGWTVIDDDEALVVATEREAYQAAQSAFPRLVEGDPSRTRNSHPLPSGMDERTLDRIRELSLAEERERIERERELEMRRQRLLQEALRRREERKQIRQLELQLGTLDCEKKKQEKEEIQRARAEIEEWRELQWEKLRQISETQLKSATNVQRADIHYQNDHTVEDDEDEGNGPKSQTPGGEELEERKKAKAAAKRKRANERKKALKAQERAEQERLAEKKALEARKATSALKCAECGGGILDSGFEKFGKRFCSTKCARAIKSTNE